MKPGTVIPVSRRPRGKHNLTFVPAGVRFPDGGQVNRRSPIVLRMAFQNGMVERVRSVAIYQRDASDVLFGLGGLTVVP